MDNILYIGRGPIGEECLDLLIASAEIHGGSIYNLEDRSSEELIIDTIKNFDIKILISVQSTKVLSSKVLEAVNCNAINLHNAKLPDYKGFNTISHAILNGEVFYTTTIHWMVPEVDCGDIAYEESVDILKIDTAFSLYLKSIEAAVRNFEKLIKGILKGDVPRRAQIGEGRFYKRSEADSLREIKDLNNIYEVDIKSRAFFIPPYEPAYFVSGGKKFYVLPEYESWYLYSNVQ